MQVAQFATEGFAETVHARAGAGEIGAVTLKACLLVIVRTVIAATTTAAGIGGTDLPVRVQAQANPEVRAPDIDVAALLAGGHLLAVDCGGLQGVAVTGQPGHAAPVIEGVLVVIVVGVAVGGQAQPGEVAGLRLVVGVDHGAGAVQITVVMGMVSAQADPMPWLPLGRDIAIDVQAILVLRGQFGQVGAVFAEALGHAQVGAQQGGVEGPVQGFDVGVAPHAVVVAQALAAQAQLFAGVGREATVADPELAHGQVAFVRLAAVVVARLGVDIVSGLLQRIGFDNVGGSDRLAHGEGAPVAAFAVDPGAQVQAHAVDVAAVAGAQVTVVL
ncbi:hypothetical protein D3C85_999850 [compost metagenome]